MNPGKLKHKTWVYKLVQTENANGTFTNDWDVVQTLRAAIEPMSGRELEVAKSQGSEATTKFTVRFYKPLTTAHRLITNFGDVYEIGSIINQDFAKDYLTLYCKKLDESKRVLVLRDEDLNMMFDEDGNPMLVDME